MHNIVITGGSGYIGSHISTMFAKLGYNVISLDRVAPLWDTPTGIKTYLIDIRNYGEVHSLFQKLGSIDCIIHCAGELGISKSYQNMNLFYEQNIFMSDTIINAALQHNVKSFIYASSAAVYANSNEPQSINSQIDKELSPYSYSKIMCEQKLKSISRYYGLNYVALRYFNVIGCDISNRQMYDIYMRKDNVIPIIIQCVKEQKPFIINGNDYETKDGTCVRDYINVIDLANLHIKVFNEMISNHWSDEYNGVYNAGSGYAHSIYDIIHMTEHTVSNSLKIIVNNRRTGDCPYLCANINETVKRFNWNPKMSVSETIKELVTQM